MTSADATEGTGEPPPPKPGLGTLIGCRIRARMVEREIQAVNDLSRQIAAADNDLPEPRGELLLEAAVKAGSIVHHLRATLDNLVTALVEATELEVKRSHCFPVIESDNNGGRRAFDRATEGLPSEHVNLLRGYQPWHGGDSPLATLHAMWNTDKHRLLALVVPVEIPNALTAGDVTVSGYTIYFADPLVPVVGFLRTTLAFVLLTIDAVAPWVEGVGEPGSGPPTPDAMAIETTAITLRDPIDRWQMDLRGLYGFPDFEQLGDLSEMEVQHWLDAVLRIRASPIAHFNEQWSGTVVRHLSRRLAELQIQRVAE